MTTQPTGAAELPDPSPDQLRAIARTARNSSGSASDDCGPLAYVLHGWRAAAIAFRAQQAALVEAQQPADCGNTPYDEGPFTLAQQPAPSAAAAPFVSDGQRALHEAILNRLSHAELLEKAHYLMELNSNQARTIGELQDLVEAAPQPSTAPQAESQPAPVRDYLPLPHADQVVTPRNSEPYGLWGLRKIIAYVDADRAARAARAPADSVTAPAGGVDDDVDAVALARYQVVPAHESMFHRFAVVAGDGKQQLYLGREIECANMARKFAGAFLDGAFYQSNIAPTPPAQAADSVLEDAARLDRERICAAIKAEDDYCVEHGDYMLDSDDCIKIVRGEWVRPDFSVDAARKQGGA